MFRPTRKPSLNRVTIAIDGRPFDVAAETTVAEALLALDIAPLRLTPATGAARMPYCMMGVCFDCLIEINGLADQQACLVRVRQGMQVRRQMRTREP